MESVQTREIIGEMKIKHEWENVDRNHAQILIAFAAFFTMFYYVSYLLKRIFKNALDDRKNGTFNQLVSRIISTLHAVPVTILSLYLLATDENLNTNTFKYNSYLIALTMNITTGYMLADLMMMFLNSDLFDWIYVIHHSIVVAAFYPCTSLGLLTYLGICRLTAEGSTLFINIRWILAYLNMKDTKYYALNGILVLISFGLFRIVPIPFIEISFYNFQQSPLWETVEFIYKFISIGGSIVFDFLNVYWYTKIIKIVLKFYKKQPAKDKQSKDQ